MGSDMRGRAFDITKCARSNILNLQPYRCARDDYKDDGTNILLDANENAYGPGLDADSIGVASSDGGNRNQDTKLLDLLGLNRYPDPHQFELKQLLCSLRNTHTHTTRSLKPENLFVGVGSDEAIDNIIRCFCVPGRDKILTCPPTYGMYAVSAQVNDVSIVKEALDAANGFNLRTEAVCQRLSTEPDIKIVYICSPGNPTANLIRKEDIEKVLAHPTWNGVVVLDEAYIDFAPAGSSLAELVLEYPNLVVMQTLSKAFGLAGIRLGAAFTSPEIAALMNNLKAPYNISSPTSALASQALQPQHLSVMQDNRRQILQQRDRLVVELPRIAGVGRFLGGTDSNYLLVEMLDALGKPCNQVALAVYEQLAQAKGVVVRFRGKEYGCLGCLRITVGTPAENDRLLADLRDVLHSVRGQKASTAVDSKAAEGVERDANSIIA